MISSLGSYVQPDFLQNRVYTLTKEGLPKTSSGGFPFATYATANHFTSEEGIYSHPSISISTPRSVYDQLTEAQKDATNIIKTFCNNRPCSFFWHHCGVDDSCKFHRLYIHLVVKCCNNLGQVNQYRVIRKVLAIYGTEVRCQKVQDLEGLLNHLQQEPLVLLACNNLSLGAHLKKNLCQESILCLFGETSI